VATTAARPFFALHAKVACAPALNEPLLERLQLAQPSPHALLQSAAAAIQWAEGRELKPWETLPPTERVQRAACWHCPCGLEAVWVCHILVDGLVSEHGSVARHCRHREKG
jgi:hypothetical protein